MEAAQMRKALRELDGQRNLRVEFENCRECVVNGALLIPEEDDGLVKVTDGARVVVLDARSVHWIEIG